VLKKNFGWVSAEMVVVDGVISNNIFQQWWQCLLFFKMAFAEGDSFWRAIAHIFDFI